MNDARLNNLRSEVDANEADLQEHRARLIRLEEQAEGAAESRKHLRRELVGGQSRLRQRLKWAVNLMVVNLFALLGVLISGILMLI